MLRTKRVVKPTCIFDFETGLNNTKTFPTRQSEGARRGPARPATIRPNHLLCSAIESSVFSGAPQSTSSRISLCLRIRPHCFFPSSHRPASRGSASEMFRYSICKGAHCSACAENGSTRQPTNNARLTVLLLIDLLLLWTRPNDVNSQPRVSFQKRKPRSGEGGAFQIRSASRGKERARTSPNPKTQCVGQAWGSPARKGRPLFSPDLPRATRQGVHLAIYASLTSSVSVSPSSVTSCKSCSFSFYFPIEGGGLWNPAEPKKLIFRGLS
jgi:hypothetical protein